MKPYLLILGVLFFRCGADTEFTSSTVPVSKNQQPESLGAMESDAPEDSEQPVEPEEPEEPEEPAEPAEPAEPEEPEEPEEPVEPDDEKGFKKLAPIKVVDTFTNLSTAQSNVDVVIALDTSSSMSREISQLENNIALFLANIAASNLDANVTIIGQDLVFSQQDLTSLTVVNTRVGSNNAISVLNTYFSNNPALASTQPLDIVVISDDDGSGIGNLASDFIFPRLKSLVTYHAVVGQKMGRDSNNRDCKVQAIGRQHMDLARKTSGLILDICDSDWSALLTKLSQYIAENKGVLLRLMKSPLNSHPAVATLNGIEIDSTLDSGGMVMIPPTIKISPSDVVEVTYWIESNNLEHLNPDLIPFSKHTPRK